MSYSEKKLLNRNFILSCICNMAFCLGFHMLIPVLPLYLIQELQANNAITGLVVALYSIGSLCIRPLSSYMVDNFQRKIIFVCCSIAFIIIGVNYIFITALTLLALIRFLHGAAFGCMGISVSTIAIDTMPSSKLGTGIGLFGTINSLSMALGPMLGLIIYFNYGSMEIFISSSFLSLLALLLGLLIKTQKREIIRHKFTLKLANFFVTNVNCLIFTLTLTCVAFGILTNYIALFVLERSIDVSAGLFFIFLSAGLITSRIFSGRYLDKGRIYPMVIAGKIFVLLGFIIFIFTYDSTMLFSSAYTLGLGFGFIAVSYQTMFIVITEASRRGAANSTYFIAWDIGIGCAVFLGGVVTQLAGLSTMYICGAALMLISILLFIFVGAKQYSRGKEDYQKRQQTNAD